MDLMGNGMNDIITPAPARSRSTPAPADSSRSVKKGRIYLKTLR